MTDKQELNKLRLQVKLLNNTVDKLREQIKKISEEKKELEKVVNYGSDTI